MKYIRGLVSTGLLLLALGLWFGCDDDPVGPREEPVDYPVYFINGTNGTIFIYHPSSRRLDSVATPYARYYKIMITADGSLIYLAGDDQTVALETESFTTVDVIPYGARGGAALSPDGSLIALANLDLRVLHTADQSLRFYDTNISLDQLVFASDSRTFYSIPSGEQRGSRELYALQFGELPGQQRFRYFDSLEPNAVMPTPDGQKLLLGLDGRFRIYDLVGDSLQTLGHPGNRIGYANIAVTPDSRYATYGAGGAGIGFPWYTPAYIHDIIRRTVVDSFDLTVIEDSLGTYPWGGIGKSVITPDGRWLVALNSAFPAQLILFDMKTMELADFIEFGDNHWLGGLAMPQVAP